MMHDYQLGDKPGVAVKWFGKNWEPPSDVAPPRPLSTIKDLLRYVNGETQPREVFPEALHVFDRKRFETMGDLFAVGGFYILKARLAQVLSRFDLGDGSLIPLTIYQEDKVTAIAGGFFIWEFGAQKSAFLPEQSLKIQPDGIGCNTVQGRWQVGSDVGDSDIALSATAASAPPDIWCDPNLSLSLFLSDAVVTAVRKGGIDVNFHLCRCRLFGRGLRHRRKE